MPSTKLSPLDDRIIIEPIKSEGITKGGIVLPENAQKRHAKGLVLAIGPGFLLDDGSRAAMTVKVGDEIFYQEFAGTELEHDGSKVRVLSEREVLAVIGK